MRLKKSGHVAIAFFAALLWIWGSLRTLDGLARAQPPPPAPTGATGDPFNGAACPFGFGLWPPAEITRQVVPAAGVGACWVRVNVYWDEIEPLKTTPRTYHWAETDSRLLSVRQAGLGPVALVGANPAWAADTPGGPVTDTQDIVDFLSALAERYDGDGIADAPGSPQVTVWELYNEPDNIHLRFRGFGVWGNNAAGYARFLATARAALRATNPNALVAIGGLGHEDTPNFDYNFPQTLFAYIRDNPGDYFDYFNFHYYPSFGHRYAAWGPDISGKTNYFRDMMAGYGLDWPIIVTESGLWSSGGVTIPGSYETQARYVAQLYSRIIALDVAVSMWLQLLDLPPGSPVIVNPERGISDYHGVPKPAHNAYRVATGKLTGVRFDRSLRPAEMGSSQAEGYRFSGPNEGRQLYVVWATDEGATGRLRVKTPAAYVSDKLAAEFPMSPTLAYVAPYLALDADDGTADGWTTVPFGPSPIYVEVARTLTVCPAGPPACNFSDIQTAADAAIEGDTVKVATGVYTAVAPHTSPAGYSGPPVISQVVYLDTSIILRGGYTTTDNFAGPPNPAANPTVLNAEGRGRVIVIGGNAAPLIEGFQLVGGDAHGLGGDGGPPTQDAGGGVYISAAQPGLWNNRIAGNTAAVGGGVYVSHGNVDFRQNTVEGNVVAGAGGGLYVLDSVIAARNNRLAGNQANQGGGLFAAASQVGLNGNRLAGNTAGWRGGGAVFSTSTLSLAGDAVTANSAAYGGGLYLGLSQAVATNTLVVDNIGAGAGSGVMVAGGTAHWRHTTIARNTGGDGSGLCVCNMPGGGASATVTLTNTILVSHAVGVTVSAASAASLQATLWGGPLTGTGSLSGSLVWGNRRDWGGAGTIITGSRNFWGDPGFVDYAAGDYHLTPSSAALNRGDVSGANIDADRQPRPFQLPDLGADEYWPPGALKMVYLPLLLRAE